jgi:hypothetical protein
VYLNFEHQNPPAGPFALEQARQHFVGAIAFHDPIRSIVIVINPDDIGGDALPSVSLQQV